MKHFSKLFAMVLAIAMCLGIGTTAFAAEIPEDTSTIVVEEVGAYTPEELVSFHEDAMVEPRIANISQFGFTDWCPAVTRSFKMKDKAPEAGTLMLMIAAGCKDPAGPHRGEKIHVKISSGIVGLISIDVPVDGKTHTYRFNGIDNPKVKIVKGNNYTTEISGPSDCLLMAVAGSVIVE